MVFCWIYQIFALVWLFNVSHCNVFLNKWVIEVSDGNPETADKVARDHGFYNLGQVSFSITPLSVASFFPSSNSTSITKILLIYRSEV